MIRPFVNGVDTPACIGVAKRNDFYGSTVEHAMTTREWEGAVTVVDDAVVGFSIWDTDGKKPDLRHTILSFTCLDEPHHRKGFGRQMVQLVLDQVRSHGVRRLNVEAEPDNVGFYSKLGFVESRPITAVSPSFVHMSNFLEGGPEEWKEKEDVCQAACEANPAAVMELMLAALACRHK